jgi:hypothetical protein
MSKNLNQGDIAYVTGAFSVTENIGRSVELVHYIQPFGEAFCQDGYFEADADGLWIVTAEDLWRNTVGGRVLSNLAGIAPQHLKPLRGDFQPEREKRQEQPA